MSYKIPFALVIDGELETGDLRYDIGEEYATFESGSRSWFLAKDSETAGEYVADRWRDMAENDPKELRIYISDEVLIQWALGRRAGPGSNHYRSLTEWIESWKDHPAEDLAGYDGRESDVTAPKPSAEGEDNENFTLWEYAIDEMGWTPTVAYRQN